MEQQINLSELLAGRKYDRNKIPKPQHVALTIDEKIIGTLGSYAVLTGLPKTGKSTFISATIGSAYLPTYQDNFSIKIHLPNERKKIGYFDTESAEFDFYRQIDKIKKFCLRSTLPEEIDAFNTREDSPKIIRALIVEYLKTNPECSVLVIDGFLDLCFNYNDEVETRMLTNWFKKITKEYNIFLIGVLHTGKGGNNDTLGHLGSNTDRWANSTIVVEKDKERGLFVMKPKFLRSSPDFEPIAIADYNGQWMRMPYSDQNFDSVKPKNKKQ
jgi:RecA-family ATPase